MCRSFLVSFGPTWMLLCLVLAGNAGAWYGEGHSVATRIAAAAMEGRLPDFLVRGRDLAAHCSQDPDVFKFEADSDILYDAESPEHYFDLERFDANSPLPDTREDFRWWCIRHGTSSHTVGTLPYAVAEATYRLAIGLAEHRRWPDDPAVQTKCLVYAGLLAHYAQDVCMPLHATIHYDGRAKTNGSSPHTGIHAAVDGLLEETVTLSPVAIDPNEALAFQDVLAAVYGQIKASHTQVSRVYELERDLLGRTDPLQPGSEVAQFAVERLRATALFTARIYATAWAKSIGVVIPEWHQRTEDPNTHP